MDQLDQAEQAESQPNFIDDYFKQNPSGSSPENFNQWQPVEDFIQKVGMQQDHEDHVMNGGSSHGSQTVVGSPRRGNFASGTFLQSQQLLYSGLSTSLTCFLLVAVHGNLSLDPVLLHTIGYGDTNGSRNTGSNSSDMLDVNSPEPSKIDTGKRTRPLFELSRLGRVCRR